MCWTTRGGCVTSFPTQLILTTTPPSLLRKVSSSFSLDWFSFSIFDTFLLNNSFTAMDFKSFPKQMILTTIIPQSFFQFLPSFEALISFTTLGSYLLTSSNTTVMQDKLKVSFCLQWALSITQITTGLPKIQSLMRA